MKPLHIDPEWCKAAVAREGDSEVGAGILAGAPQIMIEDRDTETWPYLVRRAGLRWRIYRVEIDSPIISDVHPMLRYWRWITAARVATTLRSAFWYGRCWPLELGDLR